MLRQSQERIDVVQKTQPQLVQSIEAFLLGCSMTVSVVDEYAVELYEAVKSMTSATADLALSQDIRCLWKEDDMKELLSQTRGYQSRLASLLDNTDK